MPTLRIDDDIYKWLQQQARAFEDTPNSVLRRIAGLDNSPKYQTEKKADPVTPKTHVGEKDKTPQAAFREPILKILLKFGGKGDRIRVLNELEKIMDNQLTEFDRRDIHSGTIRWQKSAEWEVRVMRIQHLLKAVHEAPRGVWALTPKGHDIANKL